MHDWGSDQFWITVLGHPKCKLSLEEGVDPSTQESSLTMHLAPSSTLSTSLPEAEDADLLEWLEAAPSLSCNMVFIQAIDSPPSTVTNNLEPEDNSVVPSLPEPPQSHLSPPPRHLSSPSLVPPDDVAPFDDMAVPPHLVPKPDLVPKHRAPSVLAPEPSQPMSVISPTYISLELGDPITNHHCGKRQFHLPILDIHNPTSPSPSPNPKLDPTPDPSALPINEIPATWLQ